VPGYRGGASRHRFHPEDGLRGVVEVDGIFGGFDTGFQQRVVEVREDVDRLVIFTLSLICESVRDSFMLILRLRAELEIRYRNTKKVQSHEQNSDANRMRTYITLQRVQKRLEILDSRIGNGDGDRGPSCFAGRLVEELHPNAPQVVRDGLNLLLLPRLFGDLALLALARGRDERRHLAAESEKLLVPDGQVLLSRTFISWSRTNFDHGPKPLSDSARSGQPYLRLEISTPSRHLIRVLHLSICFSSESV